VAAESILQQILPEGCVHPTHYGRIWGFLSLQHLNRLLEVSCSTAAAKLDILLVSRHQVVA